MNKRKVLCVVGARPNFMKIAPIITAMNAADDGPEPVLVHTGQHYDKAMKEAFFRDLGMPEPDVDLGVGSGSHAQQTAAIMVGFEPVLHAHQPDLVMVVGDVNSTIACGLVVAKLSIPLAHVEAGLRSFDPTMPEEINRILTDRISDLLFTTEESGNRNLANEGIPADRIKFTGNVMIDTLVNQLPHVRTPLEILSGLTDQADAERMANSEYLMMTLHRPANVDKPERLREFLLAIADISNEYSIVFPVHPRTAKSIEDNDLAGLLDKQRILRTGPIGYRDMLGLMKGARAVLTDSGGLQEETTYLGVPCLTLRDNTERPATIDYGTNLLVGTNPDHLRIAANSLPARYPRGAKAPPLWDGHAAERIVAHTIEFLATRGQ